VVAAAVAKTVVVLVQQMELLVHPVAVAESEFNGHELVELEAMQQITMQPHSVTLVELHLLARITQAVAVAALVVSEVLAQLTVQVQSAEMAAVEKIQTSPERSLPMRAAVQVASFNQGHVESVELAVAAQAALAG
jgi:hypothetical protein